MVLVSAIIPVLNAESTLAQSLDSALACRSECELEVIVIDDASTDATPAVARAYGDRITYIRQDRSGAAAARNRAVRQSHGQYIAFLDADDYWLAGRLRKTVDALVINPEAGLAFCDYRQISRADDSPLETIRFESAPTLEDMFSQWYSILPSTVTIRREAFLDCEGFEEGLGFGAEFPLWLKLLHKFSFAHVPEALVVYRANSPFEQIERYRAKKRSQVERTLSDRYGCRADALIADLGERWSRVSADCIFRRFQQRCFRSALYLWIDLARYRPHSLIGVNQCILRKGIRKIARLIGSGAGSGAATRTARR
jgi:glycosyltransferase involved in cell wall biosynthesis